MYLFLLIFDWWMMMTNIPPKNAPCLTWKGDFRMMTNIPPKNTNLTTHWKVSKTSFHLWFDLEYRFISQYKKPSWFQCPSSQPGILMFPLIWSMLPGEPPKTRLLRIQTRSFGQDFRIQFPFGDPVGWRRLGSFCRRAHVCKDCATQSWLPSTGCLVHCSATKLSG